MSFSEVIKKGFSLIAKELSKLESSKLSGSLENRSAKPNKTPEEYKPGISCDIQNIEDKKNCPVITIKDSSDKKEHIAYQISHDPLGNRHHENLPEEKK